MDFKDLATLVIALTGLGLGIWNRVEQWRENRRKLEEASPWAELRVYQKAAVITDGAGNSTSWRDADIVFHNPTRHRIHITKATLTSPSNGQLLSRNATVPMNETIAARSIDVDWIALGTTSLDKGRTAGKLTIIEPIVPNFPNASSDVTSLEYTAGSQTRTVRFEVECFGEEVSQKKRTYRLASHTAVKL